jgi:hypothetical protein
MCRLDIRRAYSGALHSHKLHVHDRLVGISLGKTTKQQTRTRPRRWPRARCLPERKLSHKRRRPQQLLEQEAGVIPPEQQLVARLHAAARWQKRPQQHHAPRLQRHRSTQHAFHALLRILNRS